MILTYILLFYCILIFLEIPSSNKDSNIWPHYSWLNKQLTSGGMQLRTFTQVLKLSINLRYLYSNTIQREMLYFLLHYIYLTALVTHYFADLDY